MFFQCKKAHRLPWICISQICLPFRKNFKTRRGRIKFCCWCWRGKCLFFCATPAGTFRKSPVCKVRVKGDYGRVLFASDGRGVSEANALIRAFFIARKNANRARRSGWWPRARAEIAYIILLVWGVDATALYGCWSSSRFGAVGMLLG